MLTATVCIPHIGEMELGSTPLSPELPRIRSGGMLLSFLVESKQSLSSSLTISSICQIELVVCMTGINSAVTESEHHKQT